MQQWKESLLGAKASRPRRKLQKSVTKQRSCNLGNRFRLNISSPVATVNICDIQDDKSNTQTPPPLSSAASDPSDPTLGLSSRRHARFYEREPPFPPLEQLGDPGETFSEPSHLLPNQQQRRHSSIQIRRALSISKMKPRRKTPVLSITPPVGDAPKPRATRGRTSSVDLIAEQYRTLVEVRRDSVSSDTDPQPPPSPTQDLLPATKYRRSSSYYFPDESPLDPSLDFAELQDFSPRSSKNDTVVSFEDEAVYFKPVSFSPEPPSPAPSQFPRPPSPRTTISSCSPSSADNQNDNGDDTNYANNNISLQICLDLLTRELSTAMVGGVRPASHSPSLSHSPSHSSSHPSSSSSSPPPSASPSQGENGSGNGTSALQVWAMIEAYERLRDQLAEVSATSHGRNGDGDVDWRARAREMERMFDMWLRALYAIHEDLTR